MQEPGCEEPPRQKGAHQSQDFTRRQGKLSFLLLEDLVPWSRCSQSQVLLLASHRDPELWPVSPEMVQDRDERSWLLQLA